MFRRSDSIGDAQRLLKRGTPTFVVGTAGDNHADRAIKAQAAIIRDLLFPATKIIDDSMSYWTNDFAREETCVPTEYIF